MNLSNRYNDIMGWLSVAFLSNAVSQLDAILDATYTDAKDINKHEVSGWQQKYYITIWRCLFFHLPLRLWYHQASQSQVHIPGTV